MVAGLVEVLLEHLQRRRRRGGAAVAAVLDHGADDDRRRVVRPVAAPPRLRQVRRGFGEPGSVTSFSADARLAGDVDREVAEDAGRRCRSASASPPRGPAARTRSAVGSTPLGCGGCAPKRRRTRDRLAVRRRSARRRRRCAASRACRRSRSSRRSAPSAAASRASGPGRSPSGSSSPASRCGRLSVHRWPPDTALQPPLGRRHQARRLGADVDARSARRGRSGSPSACSGWPRSGGRL